MPNIFFIDDLHLEYRQGERFDLVGTPDVVVLAGDIHTKARGVSWASATFPDIPVVYVLGNHEGWGGHWQNTVTKMRDAAKGTNVHVLHRDTVELAGIRFVGATLWTDFSACPDRREALEAAAQVTRDRNAYGMRDYRKITTGSYRRLHPSDVLKFNGEDRSFLLTACAAPFDGPTVVVTHHPPMLSAMKHPPAEPADAAYASDWEEGVRMMSPAAWLHGHTHNPRYERVGSTLLASHAAGHPEEGLLPLYRNALDVPLDGSPVRIVGNQFDLVSSPVPSRSTKKAPK